MGTGNKHIPYLVEEKEYIRNDYAKALAFADYVTMYKRKNLFEIKNVIFNGPATIVLWADGTKTVVKAQEGETFDPEKGIAMAISKKALGNKYSYYNTFKKYLKKHNAVKPIVLKMKY